LAAGRERNDSLTSTGDHRELIRAAVVRTIVVDVSNKVASKSNFTRTVRLGNDVSDLGTNNAVVIVNSAHKSNIGRKGSRRGRMNISKTVGTNEQSSRSVWVVKR